MEEGRDFEYLVHIRHCTYFISFSPESNTTLWMTKRRLRDVQRTLPKAMMLGF